MVDGLEQIKRFYWRIFGRTEEGSICTEGEKYGEFENNKKERVYCKSIFDFL